MGFHITVKGPSTDVFRTLGTKPSELFPNPFAGYLLFLFADVDTNAERWFVDNALSVDALTGRDVAFAVVAHRTHYTVRTGIPNDGLTRSLECDAAEAPSAVRVTPLVTSGRFGWVNDGDEIVARNEGVYALARDLRVTHRLPCVIALDGIPSPDKPMVVLPLRERELSTLYQRIRIAVGELQCHPGFLEYTERLRSAHDIARHISRLDEQIVKVRARDERVGAAQVVLRGMMAALKTGARRRFDAALAEFRATGICGGEGPRLDDWKRLRTLHLTRTSLADYAGAAWPLASEQLDRVAVIRSEYVRHLLGDLSARVPNESADTLRRTIAELDAEHARIVDVVVATFPTEAALRTQNALEMKALDDERLRLEHQLLTTTRNLLEMSDRPSFCELLQRDLESQDTAARYLEQHQVLAAAGLHNARANWLDWLPIRGLLSWLQSHNILGLQAVLEASEQVSSRRPPTAFASYASSDRPEVLRRVQGMNAWQPGLDIFVDFHSLYSGEPWRDRLQEEIRKRDRFLLFWSRAASESNEVAFEWRVALKVHGLGAITPVPLQPPDEARPPRELENLHFNDRYLEYLRYARILELAAAT